jgi:hypothetical protein
MPGAGAINFGLWFITSWFGELITEAFFPTKPAEMMDDTFMPALEGLIEDEEVLDYVTPTINKLWSKDVSTFPANA